MPVPGGETGKRWESLRMDAENLLNLDTKPRLL